MNDNDTKTKYPYSNSLLIEAVIIIICACGYIFGNAYYQEPVLTAGTWCSSYTQIIPMRPFYTSWLFWGIVFAVCTCINGLVTLSNIPEKRHCPYCNKEWEE